MFAYKPNNLSESLLPILVLNWVVGHQIMRYTMDSFRFIQTLFYSIIVMIIYCASIVYAVIHFVNADWFKHSETVYFVVIGTNIFILIVNLALGWIHRNKTLLMNIKSLNVDKKLTTMGINFDKREVFNYASYLVVYWIICSVTLNLAAMSWNIGILKWQDNIILISSIHHPIHVNSLVELLFCLLMRNMEIRFKQINGELLRLESSQQNTCLSSARYNEIRPIYVLQALKEIHIELAQLCNEITQIFGIQLLLSMASLFVLITTMSYNLYLVINIYIAPDKILRICVLMIWLTIHCSKLLCINHSCSRTVNEWKRAGVIIHQMETKFTNAEVCKTIQQFSIQMIQNNLAILPLGFFELGHSFLQGFLGTIATYLIIVVQMAPIPPKENLVRA